VCTDPITLLSAMANAFTDADVLSVNTIRTLAADVVQKSNSGHPGMPMGMAPVAHALWAKAMKYNPGNPHWWNRDRFVLSNGHGCTLQYILLHLSGFGVSMDDLKNFRQIDSITPGHPEVHITPGVEVTTGPLGQGIGNGVGMAMAQAHLQAVYAKEGFEGLFNNHTYVFCGDGCMQEGVASEAASLAGHLQLKNLVIIYDDNKISIDGPTNLSFNEDVPMRFRSYGFETLTVEKGDSDLDGLLAAIEKAKTHNKPTLISVRTTIGFGSSKQGTSKTHGEALGADDIKHVKKTFGFNPEESFVVPPTVQDLWTGVKTRGAALEAEWNKLFAAYSEKFPAQAAELKARFEGKLPSVEELIAKLPKYDAKSKADATRNLSGVVLNAVADLLPGVMGGSADLTPSNKTDLKKSHDFQASSLDGRYIRFGIREHGMAAIGNGMYAYGGFIPYTATFLNFIEYAFPAVRLAALSNFKQLFIMTHDSIGLGEDGPTHQPVEALQLCRATPNVLVLRPADGAETVGAYAAALHWNGPSVLALSRQNVKAQERSSAEAVLKGAYVLVEEDKSKPLQLIVIASGTEVTSVVDALQSDALKALNVRVVSMPSSTLFDQQTVAYRREVLPIGVPTVSVEASAVFGFEKYAHASVGMTTFGASGPLEKVLDKFHMSSRTLPAKLAERVQQITEMAQLNGGKAPVLNTHVDFHYATHAQVHVAKC